MTVVIELAGLEVRGRHGATPEEHEREQPFLYDLELELPEPQADRLEETVDYREVVEVVREVSATERQLLESLAAAVADALMQRFPVGRARVRVRKPEVRLDAPVDAVLRRCAASGVNAGYHLGESYPEYEDGLLVAITERRSRADIERLADVLGRAVTAEREHRQEAVQA